MPCNLRNSSVCFYAEQGTRFLLIALTTHTNVEPLSLWPWVVVIGTIFVMQASYRNLLAVNPAPKPLAAKNYVT